MAIKPFHLLRLALPPVGFLVALAAAASPPTADLRLRDVDGNMHRPLDANTTTAAVLFFLVPDCPIANSYAPEIKRLIGDYQGRGVRFFVVYVDPDVTAAEAARHAREYGYACPVVCDPEHRLVKRAGVKHTPEAAVFVPGGQRKYRGRIDDRYAALGKRREQPTSRDLRDALAAVLAGRAVRHPETEAIGCPLPPLDPKGKP